MIICLYIHVKSQGEADELIHDLEDHQYYYVYNATEFDPLCNFTRLDELRTERERSGKVTWPNSLKPLRTIFRTRYFPNGWNMLVEYKECKATFPHNWKGDYLFDEDTNQTLIEQQLVFTVVMDPSENLASYFRPVYSLEALARAEGVERG